MPPTQLHRPTPFVVLHDIGLTIGYPESPQIALESRKTIQCTSFRRYDEGDDANCYPPRARYLVVIAAWDAGTTRSAASFTPTRAMATPVNVSLGTVHRRLHGGGIHQRHQKTFSNKVI
ncbi:hypothetical protein EVAR_60174_1 [Eumeta japonica]|uniref:Uncharacterized protein n=1 Tax=Eumeta variegata TaxID=151549 RepID=A0A4C1Z763_EUMVA|nr:hypothetical protein EVAR_60174_1 [Eumeta japonica]